MTMRSLSEVLNDVLSDLGIDAGLALQSEGRRDGGKGGVHLIEPRKCAVMLGGGGLVSLPRLFGRGKQTEVRLTAMNSDLRHELATLAMKVDAFAVGGARLCVPHVLARRRQPQIFNPVVGTIHVDVVNVALGIHPKVQEPSEPMSLILLPIEGDRQVSVSVDAAGHRSGTDLSGERAQPCELAGEGVV